MIRQFVKHLTYIIPSGSVVEIQAKVDGEHAEKEWANKKKGGFQCS
jgi:hypothetical protein